MEGFVGYSGHRGVYDVRAGFPVAGARGIAQLHRRTRNMDVGHAWIRLNGREVITYAAFNDDYTTPLLGSLALETLRMSVGPVGQRLVPLDSIPL